MRCCTPEPPYWAGQLVAEACQHWKGAGRGVTSTSGSSAKMSLVNLALQGNCRVQNNTLHLLRAVAARDGAAANTSRVGGAIIC